MEMETETVFDFRHPLLGTVKGLSAHSTNRFLNVQFATLKDPFSPPVVKDGNADGVIDATTLGPTAVSFPSGLDMELGHIQQSLPKTDLRQSELNCLNLCVTVPKEASALSKLPVIVFLHGGGFAIGSNAWPQYDFRRFVRLSRESQQPVIGVNINYRLGAFGFLTSSELVQHGYQPNNGLRDQRAALLWLQKYIEGFGGNPKNVTLVGQSAGGVSGTHHLNSDEPLFGRLISMSGTNGLMKALPRPVAEGTYQTVIQRLGLQDLPPSDRINALVKLDAQELLAKLPPGLPLLPSLDSDLGIKETKLVEIYKGPSGLLDIPGKKWCKEIIIGDCQADSSILPAMMQVGRTGVAKTFKESISKSLGSEELAQQVLTAYAIGESISDDEAYKRILYFANDINFFLPVLSYAHYWSGNAYVYHFNEPNPWDGPWKGHANHILDVAFLFQNFNEHLSQEQEKSAIKFAEDFIQFAYGNAAWPAFSLGAEHLFARVYGLSVPQATDRVETVKVPSVHAERRETILKLANSIPSDNLIAAWGAFMAEL